MDFVLDKIGFVNIIYIRIRLYSQSNLYIHRRTLLYQKHKDHKLAP